VAGRLIRFAADLVRHCGNNPCGAALLVLQTAKSRSRAADICQDRWDRGPAAV